MTFYDANRADLLALDDVTLDVEEGEFLAIVGPSGCGKSTLLRLLAGLLRPMSGSVHFRGEPLTEPRRDIGYVFQRANLMPWRTVTSNIALPLEIAHIAPVEIASRTEAMISLVGLEGFAGVTSGATLRRHAAARRACPRADPRTHRPAARRAVRLAGCADPRANERRAPAHLEPAPAHGGDGHSQHQRSGPAVRPHPRLYPAARPRRAPSSPSRWNAHVVLR